VESKTKQTFAVWVTGLPASGKSTLVQCLKDQFAKMGVDVGVLESDELRKILTPNPKYDEQERDLFYSQMIYIGHLLVSHGVPVIFDATANRRAYRDRARQQIERFIEVYVDSPLATCIGRDPKGIYRSAREQSASTVPGLQSCYEPPESPDVVIHGDSESPEPAALRVIQALIEKGYLSVPQSDPLNRCATRDSEALPEVH
jgi:adenylylsulfate kinase